MKPRPHSLNAWLLATRIPTLAAAAVPVAVGTAVAYRAGTAHWPSALVALVGALLLQVGANFANDVFDYEKGGDDEHRLGPTRAAQAGLLSPRALKVGMALVFALATVCGVFLALRGGWPIIALGVAAIVSAIAYTGGPYPLGYHGLGDVFVMVFFGFVAVCGTAYVQLGSVPALAWLASVPVGSLATAILVVNNVRDREGDARTGKRTLAVRWGKRGGVMEYLALLALAYGVPLALAALHHTWAMLLPWLTLPLGLWLMRRLVTQEGHALNQVLARTAALLMAHGLLLAMAIAGSR